MSFLTMLKSLVREKKRRAARPADRRFSPSLEHLEDRLVPTTGVLDSTFGTGGIVKTAAAAEARGVAVRADGKIVAVGSNSSDFAVVRYNSDGTLDTSFSGDGIATTDFNKYLDKAFAVAVDGNKTLAVGFAYSTSGTDIALARYNNDGTLDRSFDKDGKVTTSIGKARGIGNYAYAEALGAAIQSDGKIVVVGDSHLTGNPHVLTVVRYNSDGSLDTSFGSGGKAVFTNIQDSGNKVVILGDGKIVIGRGLGAVRLNANGSLDTTFGNGGIATATVPGAQSSDGNSITVQSDGKIVVVGWTYFEDYTTGMQVAAARFNADGSLDTSFDGDGIATVNFYNAPTLQANELGNDVVIDSDGKILIGGHVGTSGYNFLVTRLNTDGSLDTAFGTNGKVETSLGDNGFDTDAYAMALQPDGKVILAGFAAGQMTLARYS